MCDIADDRYTSEKHISNNTNIKYISHGGEGAAVPSVNALAVVKLFLTLHDLFCSTSCRKNILNNIITGTLIHIKIWCFSY